MLTDYQWPRHFEGLGITQRSASPYAPAVTSARRTDGHRGQGPIAWLWGLAETVQVTSDVPSANGNNVATTEVVSLGFTVSLFLGCHWAERMA